MAHDVIMPALGMAQDTGLIVSWLKLPGDQVKVGDALLEVETDKAVMEVEAAADGFLKNVSAAAGEQVPVGGVIAVIDDSASDDEVTKQEVLPAPSTEATAATPVLSNRILASPKARRLALERGLDLEKLVEQGVPQPFHVADLDTLKNSGQILPPAFVTANTSTTQATTVFSIGARVPANGCEEFMEWIADYTDIDIPQHLVWVRFATAAFRQATNTDTDKLIVETRQIEGTGGCYEDADRSGFSQMLPEHENLTPVLILRDFTGSSITSARASLDSAAVLTISREHDNFEIAFDYRVDQLPESQAIYFTDNFAERLSDPVLHLL